MKLFSTLFKKLKFLKTVFETVLNFYKTFSKLFSTFLVLFDFASHVFPAVSIQGFSDYYLVA